MIDHKIIITGPVAAGKTTAIKAVSDVMHVSTDESASDMTNSTKSSTTVAMDYGVIKLDGGQKIHLYGTPGQERFDFMWDILAQGGIGLVLLINNSAKQPLADLDFFIAKFRDFIAKTGLVIGVSKLDQNAEPNLNKYHERYAALAKKHDLSPVVPIFETDARLKEDIAMLLEALLFSLDTELSKQHV
ncbi:ATP/GTP-binding protein [uncultured Pseudoteredinibacter sp.]|uniref:GTP-binding protein n=1 Tax=uncultured Pseudoteredinibacter sp. TaxID=1641701 RepID=UPI00261A6CB3|nr:ATP/GTP-binding protein [uncultured Pseudoteredinibacter sp.]